MFPPVEKGYKNKKGRVVSPEEVFNHLMPEVILTCPNFIFSKAAEIEWRYLEDGTEVRVSKRTGRIIAMAPDARNMWDDFTDVSKYRG